MSRETEKEEGGLEAGLEIALGNWGGEGPSSRGPLAHGLGPRRGPYGPSRGPITTAKTSNIMEKSPMLSTSQFWGRQERGRERERGARRGEASEGEG